MDNNQNLPDMTTTEAHPEISDKRTEILEKIRRLKARSNRGLFTIALFIAISIAAIRDFDFFPSFPPHVRAFLGKPPSPNMISAVLMLYSFSAIILILARMMNGSNSYSGLSHVGYLSGFFFFYHFAGAIDENFWAVFAAGITILGLESYHVWTRCMEEIRNEKETLEEWERKNRWKMQQKS